MNNRKKIIAVIIILSTLVTGGVFALQGFFGGGAAIPEDTFTRGLVGYWSFDEGSGVTAYDASGNGNNGTLVNGPKWTTASPPAGGVGALQFDGKDDYVDAGNNSSLAQANITIEAWVKINKLGVAQMIYNNRDVLIGSKTYNVGLHINTNNKFTIATGRNAWAWDQKSSNTALSANTWYHIVATVDGTNLKFYLNGKNDGSAVLIEPINIKINGNNADIGAMNVSGYENDAYLNGLIDSVRIYNRSLTEAEVKFHYNHGGPAGYWKFDEGSGTSAKDATDNNNDGTLTNFNSTDTGTAEAGDATTLTDNNKTWITNQWAGGKISITGGTGSGQTRPVASNTTTTVTVSVAWQTNPDATSVYSVIQADAWTGGKYGTAIKFDGKDDYVGVGTWDLTGASRTVSLWVNSANDPPSLDDKRFFSANYYEIKFIGGNLTSWIYDNQFRTINYPATNINANTWYYVTITSAANSLKMYVNGNLVAQNTTFTPTSHPYNLNIGANYAGSNRFFNGMVDDVRIYDYARTADEIRLDYQAGMAAHFGANGKTCDEDPKSCMAKGLVGYWDMEEGSGNSTIDKSGNGNNGALTNGPKWAAGAPLAMGKSALQFDGKDDYLDCGNGGSLSLAPDITLEAWIKKTQRYTYDGIIARDVGIWDDSASYQLLLNSSEQISLRWELTNGNSVEAQTIGGHAAADWTHVLVRRWINSNGKLSVRIYVNGKEQPIYCSENSGTVNCDSLSTNIIASNNNVTIGTYGHHPVTRFSGYIDEVRAYNRALSDREIIYHYNQGAPVAYWKLDEGSGTSVKDSSVNNYDGTISGATWVSGKYGNALNFDGVNDYVGTSFVPSAVIGSGKPFTVGMWIYPRNINSNLCMLGGQNPRFYLCHSGGKLYYGIGDIHNLSTSTAVLTNNIWQYVTLTYDGNAAATYINGINKDNNNIGAQNYFANSIYIGAENPAAGVYFSGMIDDPKIYNYARTTDDIRKDYEQGLQTYFGSSEKSCTQDPKSCVTKGLVGYWDMEEGGGAAIIDKSGNGNNGTLTNGPKWTGAAPLTIGKAALQFNGKNNYANITQSDSLILSSGGSIETWVKIKKLSTAYGNVIFMKGDGASWPNLHYVLIDNIGENKIIFSVSDGTNTLDAAGPKTPDLSENVWYHIIATWDSTQKCIYLNGALSQCVNSAIMPKNTMSGCYVNLGRSYSNMYYFNGNIDDTRIYNRALSVEEVRYHYNQGGPVAWFKLDEGRGNKAYDQTTNNNDGTLGDGTCQPSAGTCPAWIEGKSGSALDFDGSDYVVCGNNPVTQITGDITTVFWVKPNTAANAFMEAVAKGYGTEFFAGVDVRGSTRAIAWRQGSGSVTEYTSFNNVFTEGDIWYHIAVARDTATQKLHFYKNGNYLGSLDYTSTISTSTNNLSIGGGTAYEMKGSLDDVKVYNYIRTEEQIKLDYQQGLATHLK